MTYTLSQQVNDTCEVGKYTSIAGGCEALIGSDHPSIRDKRVVSNFPFKEKLNLDYVESGYSKGPIKIGNDVWLCQGVKVLSGVTIGDGAIVGAYSVVSKSIPPYAVAVGNPAKVKKFRFGPRVRNKLLKIAWWNWEDDLIKERINDFKNITTFVKKYDK